MKRFLLIIFCFTFSLSLAFSQGYKKELLWVGPTVGYGFDGIGFGANGEYGLTDYIGLGAEMSYSSFSLEAPGAKTTYSLLGFLVSGSYHFIPGKQFDPYVKLGLGYFDWGVSYEINGKEVDIPDFFKAAYASGIGVTGQFGARYHLNDNMSLRASIGFPYYFAAGVDFAFGGKPSAKRTEKKVEKEEKKRLEKVEEDIDEDETTEDETTEDEAETIEEKAPKKDKVTVFIGPYFGIKAGLNTTVPEGRKTGVAAGFPDIGVSFLLPFTKGSNVGFMLGLGHESYAYISKPNEFANDSNTYTENYNYINLSPSLYLGGFILGLNFGFPISASAKDKNGDEKPIIDESKVNNPYDTQDFDIVEHLANNLEVKLGANIPLIKNDNGMLNLNLIASYSLSGLYEDHRSYKYAYENNEAGQRVAKSEFNPSPVSIHIGMSYLFSIGM